MTHKIANFSVKNKNSLTVYMCVEICELRKEVYLGKLGAILIVSTASYVPEKNDLPRFVERDNDTFSV